MQTERKLTTVEDKVRFVVEQQFTKHGVNYVFANWSQANKELDKVDTPTIAYILPASGDVNINHRRSRAYDCPETLIAFLAPTDFDFEGNENDNIIEHMKRLMVAFVEALNMSGMFEPIEGVLHYQVVYDMLDDNVTGITIEPQLKETEGVVVCNECIENNTCDLFEQIFGYKIKQ